jgi:hypothetical protein
MQSLQMLPAHLHRSTIEVSSLHARMQIQQAAATAGAAAAVVVSECSVCF